MRSLSRRHIQRTSEDVLQVEHGSLYPALARLEKRRCISSKWELGERGREMRMYRLTARGRKQLAIEQSRWDVVVRAMARVLKPEDRGDWLDGPPDAVGLLCRPYPELMVVERTPEAWVRR